MLMQKLSGKALKETKGMAHILRGYDTYGSFKYYAVGTLLISGFLQRGGAGNIGSPNIPPSRGQPHDADVIPPTAMRQPSATEYYVGVCCVHYSNLCGFGD